MNAWYDNSRPAFLTDSVQSVVGQLASAAAQESLHVEQQQHEEWAESIGILRENLDEKSRMVQLLRETLESPDLSDFEHVILEYDFRRRGLRIDCVLLGRGIVAVVEFKRAELTAADRDQVTDYAINLVEFHAETRRSTDDDKCIVVPVLALTSGRIQRRRPDSGFHRKPWDAILREPIQSDRETLHAALRKALSYRRSKKRVDPDSWIRSDFSPSSTIIDAAISLYGQHDVSAIKNHAAEIETINKCTSEVKSWITRSLTEKQSRVIFVSGSPGAGKTLVGLQLAFDPRFRENAVFVTGNAPLVEVLSESLKKSYRRQPSLTISGYAREQAIHVIQNSTFKIVKAHAFLGDRGTRIQARDGQVVIFDEAQRTYKEGRQVLRRALEQDEAILILKSLDETYGPGCAVVALVGHNQAINTGELGIRAWFKAARERGWRLVISNETLALSEVADADSNGILEKERLNVGHLSHSLRFYRNHELENWADRLLTDQPEEARAIADRLDQDHRIWLTRDLNTARAWVRDRRIGEDTAGMIASGQARRLAAEGLFVDLKPSIAPWILAPSGDIRSSNMLETVQNQYQVQGLEMDYALVCWDADLRRVGKVWRSFKIKGNKWHQDKALEIAKNGYRVLLTRARKGMILFVPRGDESKEDATRLPEFYDEIATYLVACGAQDLSSAQS